MEQSDKGRIEELIPIRHSSMLQSPFAFYRGAALNMASDLASSPATGIRVQICGDCHLSNFGAFATPERRVIADINDLDETLPGPWEWDVKRLAVSYVLACRNNGFSDDTGRDAVLHCVGAYRGWMAKYSEMKVMDLWYTSIELEDMIDRMEEKEGKDRVRKRLAKARERTTLEHDFPDLVRIDEGMASIKDNPQLIYHPSEWKSSDFFEVLQRAYSNYRESLPEHRRVLLDRFDVRDLAIKVVGVGSVGTACGIMLLMADDADPLFLQIKQARTSVLEPFLGKSTYSNHGQRVVVGCQLMQSASDLFLGWTKGLPGRHFYVRQLRDMKIKPLVEIFTEDVMVEFAKFTGWILARAHARAGDPGFITGYLGKKDAFDQAIADFAIASADQVEQDHEALQKAVRSGRLDVSQEDL